jgi:hypothetical protein
MVSTEKTRITVFIGTELAKRFSEFTRQIGISGTALLSSTLPTELGYLAELPRNSESAAKFWTLMDKMDELDGIFAGPAPTTRFNISLDRQDAERLNQLCREKRVARDHVVNSYIRFLVDGEDGVCEAPLLKIAELLKSPRREFEEKRKNSPAQSKLLHDLDDDTFVRVEPVPQDNPYHHLHRSDEEVKRLERMIARESRRPETR